MNTSFNCLKKTLLAQVHAGGPELYDTAAVLNGNKIRLDEESARVLKNLYFYLSLVFRYPVEPVYLEIEAHLSEFTGFFIDYAGVAPGLPDIDALQSEYIRLFVNNQGFVPAAPYASCYRGDGLLISDDYFRLRQIMAGSGFKLDESVNELKDHLAVMLEFSATLLDRLVQTHRSSDGKPMTPILALLEVSYRFISPLLDGFTDNINAHATHDFYKIAARALQSVFHHADPIYSELLGFAANSGNDLQG